MKQGLFSRLYSFFDNKVESKLADFQIIEVIEIVAFLTKPNISSCFMISRYHSLAVGIHQRSSKLDLEIFPLAF